MIKYTVNKSESVKLTFGQLEVGAFFVQKEVFFPETNTPFKAATIDYKINDNKKDNTIYFDDDENEISICTTNPTTEVVELNVEVDLKVEL